MEGMNLAKLEAVVEKMLNNLQEVKRENAELRAQLEMKSGKISELESALNDLTSNQEEVSSRVTSLLSSIEDWENSLGGSGDDDEGDAPVRTEEQAESRGGGLFSLGE
ncbi:MAG: cell division protein ZapB [Desulfobulbaceae bacterium]|nr:cell division protein ZapB [Desulfobulbaceae bacterium]